MSLNYRIIQFSDDFIRGEFRNIAVLVDDGNKYELRTVDQELGTRNVETLSMSLLSRSSIEAITTIAQWYHHFHTLADPRRYTCMELHRELDLISESDGQIIAFERGVVENAETKEIYQVANWLSRRLLGDSTDFEGAVTDFLRRSEVEFTRGFKWRVMFSTEIDSFPGRNAYFDFGRKLRNGQWNLAKYLKIRYQTVEQVTNTVNSIHMSFEIVNKTKLLGHGGAFVISETIREDVQNEVNALRQYVHWIDITDPDSWQVMHRLWTTE